MVVGCGPGDRPGRWKSWRDLNTTGHITIIVFAGLWDTPGREQQCLVSASFQSCQIFKRAGHPRSTVSRPACRVVLAVPCQKAVFAVSRKPCQTRRPCRQSPVGNWVIRKSYHLVGPGMDCCRMASTVSAMSAFMAVSAVSCRLFQRVSYARIGRVADEHRLFVSCLNISTGSVPCRVRPRRPCNR